MVHRCGPSPGATGRGSVSSGVGLICGRARDVQGPERGQGKAWHRRNGPGMSGDQGEGAAWRAAIAQAGRLATNLPWTAATLPAHTAPRATCAAASAILACMPLLLAAICCRAVAAASTVCHPCPRVPVCHPTRGDPAPEARPPSSNSLPCCMCDYNNKRYALSGGALQEPSKRARRGLAAGTTFMMSVLRTSVDTCRHVNSSWLFCYVMSSTYYTLLRHDVSHGAATEAASSRE